VVHADKGLAQATPAPRVVQGPPAPPEFVEFYRAHHRALLRTAMYVGATEPEAEDALAETMKEMLRRWPEVTNPLAYAHRAVVSNFVKDRTRGLGRVRRRMVEQGAGLSQGADDPGLTTAEGIEWVRQLLAPLPPGERAVMALVVDGYTPTEIAERLGRSPQAVRHSLSDARRRLKQLLRQHDGERQAGRGAQSREEAR
jgi:RNA polymerase sigma factor (sigma-70 family)